MAAHTLNNSLLFSSSEVESNNDEFALSNCSNLNDYTEDGLPCYPFWILNAEESDSIVFGPPWWIHLAIQIFYGIICFVGLTGNTLITYLIMRFAKLKTVTNLYIVNLAIADEFFLIGIPLLISTAILGYWPFGELLCKVYFLTNCMNQSRSWFLLIMSVDRYLDIYHPITAAKWRTPQIAKTICLCAWTLLALYLIPIFMYTNTLELYDNDGKMNCNIFWPPSEAMGLSGEIIFVFYSFLMSFVFPLILILLFYIMVISKICQRGPRSKTQEEESERVLHTYNRDVTKLVLTIITFHFVLSSPFWLTQIRLVFMSDYSYESAVIIVFLLAGCLSCMVSAINPIVYFFLNQDFKTGFRRICSCGTNKDYSNSERSIFLNENHRRKQGLSMTSPTSQELVSLT